MKKYIISISLDIISIIDEMSRLFVFLRSKSFLKKMASLKHRKYTLATEYYKDDSNKLNLPLMVTLRMPCCCQIKQNNIPPVFKNKIKCCRSYDFDKGSCCCGRYIICDQSIMEIAPDKNL